VTACPAFLAKKSDLILCVGCGISDMSSYEFTSLPDMDVIVVNFDRNIESKGVYITKHIFGDAKEFLNSILRRIPQELKFKMDEWDKVLDIAKKGWKGLIDAARKSDKVPLSPGRVCDILSKMIPDDTIITVGAGMHLLYVMGYIPAKKPLTFLSAVNFGAMGFGFGAGLSAKLNLPDRTVVSILGDGDFMMTLQDIETAIREKIPLKVIIINDNSYRVLTFRQRIQLQGRVYGSLHNNPDFVKLAESFGAKGIRIERPEEIESKLKEMLSSDIITMVEVVADPNDVPPINMEATLKMSN
jgi:acetolactate synthase-1/2/3 large subunit